MRLVERVPDNTMFVSGYEHHTSECLSCGETERRLVFRRSDEPLQEELPTAPECDEAPSETALLVPTEPQPDGLALRAAFLASPRRQGEFRPLAAPQRTLSGSRTDIESLRARLDDLRQRAELSDQKAMAAKRDEEERKLFVEFWDGLVPPKLSSQRKRRSRSMSSVAIDLRRLFRTAAAIHISVPTDTHGGAIALMLVAADGNAQARIIVICRLLRLNPSTIAHQRWYRSAGSRPQPFHHRDASHCRGDGRQAMRSIGCGGVSNRSSDQSRKARESSTS
jgi:hypothetical protein